MAVQLSSNWKKLQAKIKAESSTTKPSLKEASSTTTTKATYTKPLAGGKRAHEDNYEGAHQIQPPLKRPTVSGRDQTAARPRSRSKQLSTSATTTTTSASSTTKRTPSMGVSQSSQLSKEAAYDNNGKGRMLPPGITPSLALWAADHDIAAEDLAEAYGLGGLGKGGAGGGRAAQIAGNAASDDRENAGLTSGLTVGKYIALDCEMVGIGEAGRDDALARVSVVDFFGRQVYDSYVRPQAGQRVVDWRTAVSGVAPRHLRIARPFADVQAVVADLLAGGNGGGGGSGSGSDAHNTESTAPRILIGHDVRHDLLVLGLAHPPRLIRDTAKFSGFRKYGHGRKPALRVLAQSLLGVDIQQGAHSSVEDARATMQLFRKHKAAFDVECANKFRDPPTSVARAGLAAAPVAKKKLQKKKKKKR
ncbi:RNA exonuclease 4 [Niveomyces insectorum RCEF 264]|uniref:RNA exonuclease 4 n=1 Tax=Niveomyces insectorum RCEF 264 TaxID=1081102 RepID=A0A162LBP9_9HYPO|nr:RNA exonuclease 4 [Niveomyces insectorum RCEF 264]